MLVMSRSKYAPFLSEVNLIMLRELAQWRSKEIERLWFLTESQLQRRGKQLRPLLSLMMTEYLGGELRAVIPAAASVEFYHMASLVIDDVQDHSEVRRNEPTVNASVGTSTAVNMALFVRTLSYHLVNRCTNWDPAEQLRIHQELDHAATLLVLGQSIDIGWQENWYESYRNFPYQKMIEGKSGALFGCAAAVGACVSQADPEVISAARDYGTAFGALYQLVDDYLDVFGDGSVLRRPKFDDFREGKMTSPIICLLATLEDKARDKDVELVLAALADGDSAGGWSWLLDLMDEHDVVGKLRKEISQRASCLADPAIRSDCNSRAADFGQIVELIVAPACQG